MCLSVSGEVATRCIVLPTICTGILGLGFLRHTWLFLRAAVTCKKGLICVSSRSAPIELEDRCSVNDFSLNI